MRKSLRPGAKRAIFARVMQSGSSNGAQREKRQRNDKEKS